MSINLDTIPTNTDLTVLDTIPLNTDYTPYQDLQAQGRYGQLLMPDNLPALLSMLYGPRSDGNPNGQLCSFDGKHNLNVNVAAGGGGGVGMEIPTDSQVHFIRKAIISGGGDQLIQMFSNCKHIYGVTWDIMTQSGATGFSSGTWFRFQIGIGPVASLDFASGNLADWTNKQYGMSVAASGTVMFSQPIDVIGMGGDPTQVGVYANCNNVDCWASASIYGSTN